MGTLFEFHGPAEALAPVQRALAWVIDPLEGRNLLEQGVLRRVRMADGRARVELCLPPSPLRALLVEDLQAELFDHLQGRWAIEIVLVQPRGGGSNKRGQIPISAGKIGI